MFLAILGRTYKFYYLPDFLIDYSYDDYKKTSKIIMFNSTRKYF